MRREPGASLLWSVVAIIGLRRGMCTHERLAKARLLPDNVALSRSLSRVTLLQAAISRACSAHLGSTVCLVT